MSSLPLSVPNPALYLATSPASGGPKIRMSSADLMIPCTEFLLFQIEILREQFPTQSPFPNAGVPPM